MLFHSSTKAFLNCVRMVGVLTLLYPSVQIVPQMLYGGQTWTVWWPVQLDNAIVCQKILTYPGYMWPGTVLLYSQLKLLPERDCNWLRISSLYFTAVILLTTTINCDFTPKAMPPQTITEPHPKPIPFSSASLGKAFPAKSVYMTSTIQVKKSEMRLVSKRTLVSTASLEIARVH